MSCQLRCLSRHKHALVLGDEVVPARQSVLVMTDDLGLRQRRAPGTRSTTLSQCHMYDGNVVIVVIRAADREYVEATLDLDSSA